MSEPWFGELIDFISKPEFLKEEPQNKQQQLLWQMAKYLWDYSLYVEAITPEKYQADTGLPPDQEALDEYRALDIGKQTE